MTEPILHRAFPLLRESQTRQWLLLITLIATINRLPGLGYPPTGDEKITRELVTSLSYWELLTQLHIGQPHWPPYYFLVRITHDLGAPVLAARWWSFAAGVLLIPATFALARRWLSTDGSLVAALLVSASPLLAIQSGWLRMYSLFALATVLTWLAYEHARVHARWWYVFGAALLATLWLHPFGLLVLAAVAVVALRDGRRQLAAAVGAMMLPPAALLVGAIIHDPMLHAGSANLSHLATPPGIDSLLVALGTTLAGGIVVVDQVLVALMITGVCLGIGWATRAERGTQIVLVWLSIGLGGLVIASYLVRPVFQLKYLGFLAPAAAILVARTIEEIHPIPAMTLLAAILVMALLARVGDMTATNHRAFWAATHIWRPWGDPVGLAGVLP